MRHRLKTWAISAHLKPSRSKHNYACLAVIAYGVTIAQPFCWCIPRRKHDNCLPTVCFSLSLHDTFTYLLKAFVHSFIPSFNYFVRTYIKWSTKTNKTVEKVIVYRASAQEKLFNKEFTKKATLLLFLTREVANCVLLFPLTNAPRTNY